VIRNTTGWEYAVDRAVAGEGHGNCGGWGLSITSLVICRCGTTLFEVKAVA
jgi:hypothetical protein